VAVIVKYVVERNGVEKMTFTSKKDADAYDKMLDIADQFALFLRHGDVKLSEEQSEQLGLYLADNRDCINNLLKGNPFEPAQVNQAE
jgi:dsDNA-binding SOS-regulon protein